MNVPAPQRFPWPRATMLSEANLPKHLDPQEGGKKPHVGPKVKPKAGETVAVTLKPRQEERLQSQAMAAIEGIRAGRFPALPEERKCAACEFALICPV